MKFRIVYKPDLLKPTIAASVDYEFQCKISVTDHLHNIYAAFSHVVTDLSPEEQFSLQCSANSLPIDNQKNLLVQLAPAFDSGELIFTTHPVTSATQILQQLANSKDKVKDIVFNLRKRLENPIFAERFIDGNGIAMLLDIIATAPSNTKAYALTALQATSTYFKGIKLFLGTENVIGQLLDLLESTTVAVQRQSLELLVLICSFDERGCEKIRLVASEKAELCKETPVSPYTGLVRLVSSGDLDTQINSLTLLNCLLVASMDDSRTSLIHQLEKSNLSTFLISLGNVESEYLRNQIQIYTQLSSLDAGEQSTGGKKKNRMTMQQPLYPLMKKEITRVQRKITDLLKSTEFVPASSRTPLIHYAERITTISPDATHFLPDSHTLQDKVVSLEKENEKLLLKLKEKKHNSSSSSSSSGKERVSHKVGKKGEGSEKSLVIKCANLERELMEERTKQEEASANVQKLAQVVKLMKVKYDELKDQVAKGTTTTTSSASSDFKPTPPSSPIPVKKRGGKEHSLRTSLTSVGFSSREDNNARVFPSSPSRKQVYSFAPLSIMISEEVSSSVSTNTTTSLGGEEEEQVTSLKQENLKLQQRNEQLQKSLVNAASLDSLSSLMLDSFGEEDEASGLMMMMSDQDGTLINDSPTMIHSFPVRQYGGTLTSTTPRSVSVENDSERLKMVCWRRLLLPPVSMMPSVWDNASPLPFDMPLCRTLFTDTDSSSSSEKSAIFPANHHVLFDQFRNKLPQESVVSAILSLDSSVSDHVLALLLQLLGKENEVILLSDAAACKQITAPVDLFVHHLYSTVSNVYERVYCWSSIRTLLKQSSTIQNQLTLLLAAINEIKCSESLKQLFRLLLTTGNYLNEGTFRGRAEGFHLTDSVPSFFTLLDNHGESYISFANNQFQQQLPHHFKDLKQELVSLQLVGDTNLEEIQQQAKALHEEKKRIEFYATLFTDSSFTTFFHNSAVGSTVEELDRQLSATKEAFKEVVLYFVPEDDFYASSVDSAEFLGTILRLVSAVGLDF